MVTAKLREVVGANARRLRLDAGITTDRLASEIRACGIPSWNGSKVMAFEKGHTVAITMPTLIVVAAALQYATGHSVSLADLVAHQGMIQLSDTLSVSGDSLAAVVGDAPMSALIRRSDARFSLCEVRLAKRLDVDIPTVVEQSIALWGRPFEEERDRRVGAAVTAQRRGHVTRAMEGELVAAIEATARGQVDAQ